MTKSYRLFLFPLFGPNWQTLTLSDVCGAGRKRDRNVCDLFIRKNASLKANNNFNKIKLRKNTY